MVFIKWLYLVEFVDDVLLIHRFYKVLKQGWLLACFTCCSGDDSLRVKVSEEQAVDQGRFSEPRFTF